MLNLVVDATQSLGPRDWTRSKDAHRLETPNPSKPFINNRGLENPAENHNFLAANAPDKSLPPISRLPVRRQSGSGDYKGLVGGAEE